METKKGLFILMLFVFTFTTGYSQGKDRVSLGLRGGANISNVTHVNESQSVTGGVFGLTSTYSFNEHHGLTLDVLYSVEGYKAPFEKYKLRYLQVPVYFNYFFGQLGDRWRPKIYAGLSPSFFLTGTLNELDVNERYFNPFILHATGGIGINYRFANRVWLNTDLRGFMGLHDIRENKSTEVDGMYPRTLQASLGLAYGLSKL